MFGLFKKSELAQLQKKYRRLMEESHRLSAVNRKAADEKFAEAEEIMKKIEALPK